MANKLSSLTETKLQLYKYICYEYAHGRGNTLKESSVWFDLEIPVEDAKKALQELEKDHKINIDRKNAGQIILV